MTKGLARLLISIGLLATCAFAGDTEPKTGAVRGTVLPLLQWKQTGQLSNNGERQ